jgi:hypothetical protein
MHAALPVRARIICENLKLAQLGFKVLKHKMTVLNDPIHIGLLFLIKLLIVEAIDMAQCKGKRFDPGSNSQ